MLMFVHLAHVDLGTPTTPPTAGPPFGAGGVGRTSSLGCTRVAVLLLLLVCESRVRGGLTGTVEEDEEPAAGITAVSGGFTGAAPAGEDAVVLALVVIVDIVESVMIRVTVLTSAMGRDVDSLKSSTASGRFAAMLGHHWRWPKGVR